MENELQEIINEMGNLCIELEKLDNWSIQRHAARINQDLRNYLVGMRIDDANRKRSLI
ncbi:MAG TPA: hypothetical protein ACFYEC_00295 [Candidatus Brocadiaceae bacterium]